MFSKTLVLSTLLASIAASPSGKPWNSHQSGKSISSSSSTSEWDYIVVGGGPAGIIVAQRLAEKDHKVLLLERGGPSFASSGGNATTSWNTNGLTPYDVPSQINQIFAGGFASECPDVPGAAGCLLGGVSVLTPINLGLEGLNILAGC
jgi:cellobiose dehydrogenase (acceptor)